MHGRRFQSDDDVIDAVSEYLKPKDVAFFQEGMAKLYHGCAKYM